MPFEDGTFVLSGAFMLAVAVMFILGGLGVIGTVRVRRCHLCQRFSLAPARPKKADVTACWRCRHPVHVPRAAWLPHVHHHG